MSAVNIFEVGSLPPWFRSVAHRVGGLRKLAEHIGVADTVLSQFLSGKRRISPTRLTRGAVALTEGDPESLEQALALIELYSASRDRVRRYHARLWVEGGRLLHWAHLTHRHIHDLDLSALALRELCAGAPASLSPTEIAVRLRGRPSVEEVVVRLAELQRQGLLAPDEQQRPRRAPYAAPLAAGSGLPPMFELPISQAQTLAIDSLGSVPSTKRSYQLLIQMMSPTELANLQLELSRLHMRVVALCEGAALQDQESGEVYALLTQLLPLTRPISRDGSPMSAGEAVKGAAVEGDKAALLYDGYHDYLRVWVARWRDEERRELMAKPEAERGPLRRNNMFLATRLISAHKRGRAEGDGEEDFNNMSRLGKHISDLLNPSSKAQIDPATISAWGEVLGLNPRELMYFSASVYRERALAQGQDDEAKRWGQVMRAVRQIGLASELPSIDVAQVQHWLPIVLSELLFHPGFHADHQWLREALRPAGISDAQIEEALHVLKAAKIAVEDPGGRLHPVRPRSCSLGPAELPLSARDIYRSCIQLGRWAQDALSPHERALGLLVVRVPPSVQAEVKAELQRVRELVQGRLDAALESQEVPVDGTIIALMTCCWFPLSEAG